MVITHRKGTNHVGEPAWADLLAVDDRSRGPADEEPKELVNGSQLRWLRLDVDEAVLLCGSLSAGARSQRGHNGDVLTRIPLWWYWRSISDLHVDVASFRHADRGLDVGVESSPAGRRFHLRIGASSEVSFVAPAAQIPLLVGAARPIEEPAGGPDLDSHPGEVASYGRRHVGLSSANWWHYVGNADPVTALYMHPPSLDGSALVSLTLNLADADLTLRLRLPEAPDRLPTDPAVSHRLCLLYLHFIDVGQVRLHGEPGNGPVYFTVSETDEGVVRWTAECSRGRLEFTATDLMISHPPMAFVNPFEGRPTPRSFLLNNDCMVVEQTRSGELRYAYRSNQDGVHRIEPPVAIRSGAPTSKNA